METIDSIQLFEKKKATAKKMCFLWSAEVLVWLSVVIMDICLKRYDELWATSCLLLLSVCILVSNITTISDYDIAIALFELDQIDMRFQAQSAQVLGKWHDMSETPENNTYVLTFDHGNYVVMYYRNAMFEFPPYYQIGYAGQTRVDRWMYIPGNTAKQD